MKRDKLTLAWRGETTVLPDIIFDDYVPPAPAELVAVAPAARALVIPPVPVQTIEQQHLDNVLLLMDGWADWVRTGEPIAEGAPRQCLGAPDARIHSFEDMEIEVNKRLVREVHTAVWELPVLEREAVMMHYGLNTRNVWKTDFDRLFDMVARSLFSILKTCVAR